MKDIKSFIIGFLSCVCIMLFMGQTSSNSGQGKYQGFRGVGEDFMIDTQYGHLYYLDDNAKWKLVCLKD